MSTTVAAKRLMCDFLMGLMLEMATLLPWPKPQPVARLRRMWSVLLTQPFVDPSLVFRVLSFPLLLQAWENYLFKTQLLADEEEQDGQKHDKDPNCRQEANGFKRNWQENTKEKISSQWSAPAFSSNTWSDSLRIVMFTDECGKYSTSPDWLASPGLYTGRRIRTTARYILQG